MSDVITLDPLARLARDIHDAARTLGDAEARYLVDAYYQLQKARIGTANQQRSLEASGEPHAVVRWFKQTATTLEGQMRRVLGQYSQARVVGQWAELNRGIGPVLSAGLLAHLGDRDRPTVGRIWRFAGLDPTVIWKKGEKRPWNARLKTLCWKVADSFVKQSGHEDCLYGRLYVQRKQYEVERDTSEGNAETAKRTLETRKFKDKATRAVYESGHLPDGRLDLQARRWTVKLFLSHWHHVDYFSRHGEHPPKPYVIAILGHANEIQVPYWPFK